MPYTLPHRPGYTVVHVVHEEGERCEIGGLGSFSCGYRPTWFRRLRWRFGL